MFREDACFDPADRLFHNFAPRNEKLFCPFVEYFFGTLTSVAVLRRVWEGHSELLMKRSSSS